RAADVDAGDVDQDAEPGEFVERPRHQRRAVALTGDVRLDPDAPAPVVAGDLLRRGRRLIAVPAAEHQVGPGRRQPFGDRPPEPGWTHIPFPAPRLQVAGLPWFAEDSPVLRRLPARLKDTFRPGVWDLAQHTSGGRIRFRTDSRRVGVTAKAADVTVMHHFT